MKPKLDAVDIVIMDVVPVQKTSKYKNDEFVDHVDDETDDQLMEKTKTIGTEFIEYLGLCVKERFKNPLCRSRKACKCC